MPAPPPPPLRGDTIGVGRQNSAGSLSHKTKHPAYLIVFVHSVPILPNRLSSVQMAGWGFCLVRSGLQRIYRSLFRSVHARLPGKHPLPPRRMEWIDFGHYWRINSGHRHRCFPRSQVFVPRTKRLRCYDWLGDTRRPERKTHFIDSLTLLCRRSEGDESQSSASSAKMRGDPTSNAGGTSR